MVADESHDGRTRTYIVLTKGTMVSHYRIVEKIGAGGMGEVYLAEDTKLKRKVALKFLPGQFAADADFKARFVREAEATAKLDHPNIVTIHEVSEFQGRPFFAMQLVEGQSLRVMAKSKELDVDRIIELAIQICDGLGAAHNKKVVHRDIKPSNIVIDAYGRPKILDFGLAAIQGGEQLTKTGSTLGTIRYMSPEQVQGQEVDHRSDLFSLGVVLYELISGRTPFDKENEAATLKAITQDNPEPLARYKSDIPDELQRTVSKLLEKDSSLRYQHADGVISDLKRMIASTQSSIAMTQIKQKSKWPMAVSGLVIIAALVGALIRYWPADDSVQLKPLAPERKMLAVLPFENLGAPEDEYFADGITDEITSRLAAVHSLGVISRTSAMSFKGTAKKLQQIAAELGVDYILEGTIRWDKSGDTDRVRITPQLIRVSDDTHLWADNYDRTIDQIFAVQTDIATSIVGALDVALLKREQAVVGASLTDSPEAYDYYLRSVSFSRLGFLKEDVMIAVELAERAVALDSGFAQAWAQLANARVDMYHYNHDRSPARLESARIAADFALGLAPQAVESHLALALYYYHGLRDYESALRELSDAEILQPNNAQVYDWRAAIERRRGHWEQAKADHQRAIALSPLNPYYIFQAGITYRQTREFQTADSLFQRAKTLLPDMGYAYIFPAHALVSWRGDIAAARKIMQEAEEKVTPAEIAYYRAELEMLDRNYQEALQQLTIPTYGPFGDSADYYNWKGLVHRRLGDKGASFNCYDSARAIAEPKVQSSPDNPMFLRTLAQAYAGLGLKDKSLEMCQRAVDALPMSEDAIGGTATFMRVTWVLVDVAEYELALDNLEILLANPSWITTNNLKLAPRYDPLRDHPRFKALIEKYEKEHGT